LSAKPNLLQIGLSQISSSHHSTGFCDR